MASEQPTDEVANRFRAVAWPMALGAVALLLIGLVLFGRPAPTSDRASDFSAFGRNIENVALTDSNGGKVQWRELNGTPRVVFFGFTRCPEVCPVTVAAFSAAMTRLGPAAKQIRIDFVSLDPERDTPQLLHDYLGGFGPQFRGYSGSVADTAILARSFRVSYQKQTLPGGDYTLDHTAIAYLLDRAGNVIDIATYNTPPDHLAEQLRALLQHG